MINEILMQPGSFDFRLKKTAPWTLVNAIDEFGHIVITETWVDHNKFADAAMLDMARYTGVVLEVEFSTGETSVYGAGLAWWLGDSASTPDLIETKISLSGSTLSNAVDQLLPSTLTKGTISEPTSAATYTGEFQFTSPLSALRTVCETLDCEFYIHPDGTFDAGPADLLFSINTPKVITTNPDQSGSDPNFDNAPVRRGRARKNARDYLTKVVAVEEGTNGAKSTAGSSTLSPATSYKDLNGNTFVRVGMASGSLIDTTDITEYTDTILADRDAILWDQDIEVSGAETGTLRVLVGDAIWVYDPPVLSDTTNQEHFRGDVVYPRKLRLFEASFGLTSTMGVYYRDKDGTYTDLSRWIVPEVI